MKTSFSLSSLFIALLTLPATVTSEQNGSIRKRDLQISGGGSFKVCFSENSSVQVFGKGETPMKELQVGDLILTGDKYQPVYAFAHLDRTAKTEFVQIRTEKGNYLEVTGSHLVFVDGKLAPVRVDSIKIGDTLQGAVVTEIASVERVGLYAPLTADGKLIVDGIKASNYVSLPQSESNAVLSANFHWFSHIGVSPFRLFCNGVSFDLCEDYNDEGIPYALSFANEMFEWVMELPTPLQALLVIGYLVFAVILFVVECFNFSSVPPTTWMAVAAGCVFTAKTSGMRTHPKKVKAVY